MNEKPHWQKIEETLQDYAQKSINSKGRKHPEPEHGFRSPYQRDKDRIVHSRAFRRLEYKTQVFTNPFSDHYRTRLTHTIEVAGIGRTVSRALGVNEDLSEAIALAHDVGHPPFGHIGESILNKLMKDHDGFEHNVQSTRILEQLEHKYPSFDGLNLTHEVLSGLVKHEHTVKNAYYEDDHTVPEHYRLSTLEAQIVDIADEITYNSHDLDDGLTSNILRLDDLKNISLWQDNFGAIRKKHPNISLERAQSFTIRGILDSVVTDLINTSTKNIEKHNIKTQSDYMEADYRIIALSDEMYKKHKELKNFLFKNFYKHPQLLKTQGEAENIITALFKKYSDNPSLFLKQPEKVADVKRAICDYIAGMTDKFAYNTYSELF